MRPRHLLWIPFAVAMFLSAKQWNVQHRVPETAGAGLGAVPGGGVIIDSSGRRHVFTPRPASLGDRAAKTFSRVALPELPWPDLGGAAASPGARRLRAVGLLVLSMLVSFALLRWARRFRP